MVRNSARLPRTRAWTKYINYIVPGKLVLLHVTLKKREKKREKKRWFEKDLKRKVQNNFEDELRKYA